MTQSSSLGHHVKQILRFGKFLTFQLFFKCFIFRLFLKDSIRLCFSLHNGVIVRVVPIWGNMALTLFYESIYMQVSM